jgi:hypothetical protein
MQIAIRTPFLSDPTTNILRGGNLDLAVAQVNFTCDQISLVKSVGLVILFEVNLCPFQSGFFVAP